MKTTVKMRLECQKNNNYCLELLYGCPVGQVDFTVGVPCPTQSGKQQVFLRVDSEIRVRRAYSSHALPAGVHNVKTTNPRQVTLRRLLCPEIHINQDDDGEAAQAEAREVASGGEGTRSRDDMPTAEPPKSGVDAAGAGEPRPPVGEGRE